jgi:hypothetical protein
MGNEDLFDDIARSTRNALLLRTLYIGLPLFHKNGLLILELLSKHQHLLLDYREQHKGEKMVIGDNLFLSVSSCGDVIIDTTKFGDVIHVLGVGPILLFICHITNTNKKVEFLSDRWVMALK